VLHGKWPLSKSFDYAFVQVDRVFGLEQLIQCFDPMTLPAQRHGGARKFKNFDTRYLAYG